METMRQIPALTWNFDRQLTANKWGISSLKASFQGLTHGEDACPIPCGGIRASLRRSFVHMKRLASSQSIDHRTGMAPERKLVEAGGIEPPSEGLPSNMTTCLADALISLLEPPAAGSLGASRFGFQPHPLRQENRPIPLNDVLSDPVGENR